MPNLRCLALVLGVALASGCAAPEPDPSLQPAEPGLSWSLEYLCGPGHDLPLPLGGGCMGRLADDGRTLGEPQAALHPTDPDVFVIAASDGRRPDALAADLPATEPRGLAVYVTRDGGLSFVRHRIDLQAVGGLPYNAGLMGADPAVVFTPDGTLHVAGLIITGSAGTINNPLALQTTLFAVRSADLGESWEAPVILASGSSNDREWLAASPQGEVVVTWRDHTRGLSVFARGPGGLSAESAPVDLPECLQVSNTVWVDGTAVAACQEDGGLRLLELADPPVPRGHAPGACPSNSARLAATPLGVLVATCYFGTAAISLDGGWTWSPTLDVFAELAVDDGWDAGIGPNVFAVGADGLERVHFTLTRFPSSVDQQPNGDGRPVAHAVLDPRTATFPYSMELQAESGSSGPMGYGFADDFYSISFEGERGLLVWTSSDWATHFVLLRVPAVSV